MVKKNGQKKKELRETIFNYMVMIRAWRTISHISVVTK